MSCPFSAFCDIALSINVSIDQSDVAFIGFRLFIQQFKDSLSSGQCHDDGIDLIGNLVDRHVEGAGKHHESHKVAKTQ